MDLQLRLDGGKAMTINRHVALLYRQIDSAVKLMESYDTTIFGYRITLEEYNNLLQTLSNLEQLGLWLLSIAHPNYSPTDLGNYWAHIVSNVR